MESRQLKILAMFEGCLVPGEEQTDASNTFCWAHIKRVAGIDGLKLKRLNKAEIGALYKAAGL